MPTVELGSVKTKEGDSCRVRWDDAKGVVQVRVYCYPTKSEPHWDWITVGIAKSVNTALQTAQNWLQPK
jgi:hypothetical protein